MGVAARGHRSTIIIVRLTVTRGQGVCSIFGMYTLMMLPPLLPLLLLGKGDKHNGFAHVHTHLQVCAICIPNCAHMRNEVVHVNCVNGRATEQGTCG